MGTKRKKILKIILIVLAIAAILVASVTAEMLLNAANRGIKAGSDDAFDRAGLEAVRLSAIPNVKTEQSNFSAAVLWTLSNRGRQKELTEAVIAEEAGTKMGEFELYNALERYMKNARREQVRNLTDAQVLKKIHENLAENRPLIATVEDGNGGAKYAAVTGFDPEGGSVSFYDFELGRTEIRSETDFLASMKLKNLEGNAAWELITGTITMNALMIVW